MHVPEVLSRPLTMVGEVRRALTAVAVSASFVLPAGAAAQTAEPLAAQLEPPLPSPVVAGDWPDPDVSLIDGSYYAVATSGGWSPTFRILQSTDLRSWTIGGSAFQRPPGWAKDSFWAPELAPLPSGGYALFYSAMPKRPWQTRSDGATVPYRGARVRPGGRMVPRAGRPWYCLGVATAPSPLGPWRDLGKPLRCTPRGTIDPTPVVDGDRLYLVYKEDGNAFRQPTPILLQELRADGRALLGAPRELLRNQPRSWEREVIEAPYLVQRDGGWTMLYSGALCCSPDCAYAVGAARAPTLAGPWTRYPGNPILRSGNGWRCPGHVSVVGDHVAFHAYRSGIDILGGRQLHVAPLTWRPDGWPAIGDGRPLPPAAGALPVTFDDAFAGPGLAADWEWPGTHPPGIRVGGGLALRAPVRSSNPALPPRTLAQRFDAGLLTRRLAGDRFTATAVVDRSSVGGRELAGVAVTRGGPFDIGGRSIGIAIEARDPVDGEFAAVTEWRRGAQPTERGNRVQLRGRFAHLRIVASGRRYKFYASSDGVLWLPVGPAWRSPVDETARIGLTVGGQRSASARFTRATLTEP
jgi:xylan 1,4-beta-xylosidase